MKRVVSVLLLVCMLVSLMGMGTAAYAEELADGTAVVEQTGDAPAAEQEPTGGDAEPETPTTPEQPQPTEAPLTEGDGQGTTQESEATPTPEVTAQPAADEGFFAALSDEELSALTAELARLGYNVTDRAGLYALAVQLGIGDLENFRIWLDNELYILENAKVEANGKLYESLDEVVALLANDSARAVTAKLLDNAAVYGLEVPAAHELTLDLNGFALVLEMQEGETAPAPVAVSDRMDKDENGNPVYSYAALTLKNGTVSAGSPNALAIYDAGRLTLANVNVGGGIHVAESYERLTTLSIEPGDAFKTGFVNGAITADAGMDNAIRITGGDFITDVSAYIDTTAYECTKNEQTGLYTVARIKGADITSYTGDDAADAANGAAVKVPSLKITAEPNAELGTAADVALENASVKLAGLESALKETSLAEIIAAYEAAAPVQTQQARGMSRAVVIAAGDESTDNAGKETADTAAVADGTELQLKVKAVLTAAVEGSSVSYEVKPYAVINGVEVPVKNEWLNGQAMLLSLYTGFLPKTVEHVHDDGTVETIDLNNCTYNSGNGVLTMNVSEFSEFKVQAAVDTKDAFKSEIENATADDEIELNANIELDSEVTIDKNLTINLNGKTLSMTGTDSVMFNITDGVTLTIKGGGIGGTLEISSGYIAAVESGCTLVLGDEYTANMTATFNATAPMQPAAVGQTTGNVRIFCAVTSFNPSSYVSNPYVAIQDENATTYTVDEYAAKLTRYTGTGLVVTPVNPPEYYKTLKEAVSKVTSASQADKIELLRNIDLSSVGEDQVTTLSKMMLLDGGTNKYEINNGIISVANDSSTTASIKTLNNLKIGGSITVNATTLNLLNVEVTGDVTDSNGGSNLELANTDIAGALSVGDGSKLNFATGSVKSITATTTASTTNRDIKLSKVNVTNSIDVGAYSNVDCNNVTAASLTIADSPKDSTVATNPSADIKNCSITTVAIGERMHKVEFNGLTAETASIGDDTGTVVVRSLSGASNIETLTIGANCGTTTIEGNLNGKNTTIGTLTVSTGTNAELGEKNSDAAKDQRLVVNTITSNGLTTIKSGTYETLNGDGTKNTFELYGGNYPTDYSQYCACDQDSNTGYYDHYVCKYQTAEGRYRVEQLTPKVLSVTPSTVVRGTKTPVQIVVNVPYTHACNMDTLTVTGVNNNSGTMARSLEYGTDYTVTQETSKDAAGNDVPTGNSVITISGDYVAANTYQSYFVDTQMGKVSASATVRTTLATTNRRSGIIRTGDDSNIGLLIGIMVLALAVAVAVVVILKKKKSQTDTNDVTDKTKPKEPKE